MNPAFSVILLTVATGAAQGLAVVLALATLAGMPLGNGLDAGSSAALSAAANGALTTGASSGAPSGASSGFLSLGLGVTAALGVLGLIASFFHLGRPERAWRAASMWRTSWLSREVIVLPAFIGVVVLWWLAAAGAWTPGRALTQVVLPLAAIVLAAALWYCTAMIYACIRFIEEWAQPLTPVNFALIGLSSGLLLACALGAAFGQARFVGVAGPAALAVTLIAWFTRSAAMRRNARLRHRSTLQSATGIAAPQLVQKSMGMSAGSFNTREFFHRASAAAVANVKLLAIGGSFVVPAILAAVAIGSGSAVAWLIAVLSQLPGLIADRWLFFAQAKHPQNLYYQVVS